MNVANFCNWSLDQCREVDKQTERSRLPDHHQNMATFPTLLLYLVSLMGGLGLPSFSDNLQLEKWQMINRLLQSDPGSNGGFFGELDGLRFPLARVDD